MAGKRTRRPERDGRTGWFERVLLSMMGPPQVGDVSAPPVVAANPAAALCRRCGQLWDAHPRVRTSNRTYATCPPDDAASG